MSDVLHDLSGSNSDSSQDSVAPSESVSRVYEKQLASEGSSRSESYRTSRPRSGSESRSHSRSRTESKHKHKHRHRSRQSENMGLTALVRCLFSPFDQSQKKKDKKKKKEKAKAKSRNSSKKSQLAMNMPVSDLVKAAMKEKKHKKGKSDGKKSRR